MINVLIWNISEIVGSLRDHYYQHYIDTFQNQIENTKKQRKRFSIISNKYLHSSTYLTIFFMHNISRLKALAAIFVFLLLPFLYTLYFQRFFFLSLLFYFFLYGTNLKTVHSSNYRVFNDMDFCHLMFFGQYILHCWVSIHSILFFPGTPKC